MADQRQRKPEPLTQEELEEQATELPEREAMSLVNLGMPIGSPVTQPLDPGDINDHHTIDPPSSK
jgi:hypothetical protein